MFEMDYLNRPWIKYTTCCATWIAFAVFGLMAVPLYWIAFRYWAPEILSGRFFAKYDWSIVIAGGAFDQGGITKWMIFILIMEVFAWLGRDLIVRLSRWRAWRIGVNAIFLLAIVMPFVMSMFCAWELARYIAVMGVTPSRISGVRYLILFIFTPVFCVARWHLGRATTQKFILMMIVCITVAYGMFFTLDAIARQSVASHPRPGICWPNGVSVPSEPEACTNYGLKEVVFGVSTKSDAR